MSKGHCLFTDYSGMTMTINYIMQCKQSLTEVHLHHVTPKFLMNNGAFPIWCKVLVIDFSGTRMHDT